MSKSTSPIPVRDDALTTRELVLTLNKRLAAAVIMVGVACIALAVVIFSLFPLKKDVPYIVQVEKTTGAAFVPPQTPAVNYSPETETIHYFVRRWVTDALTINQYSTVQSLDPRARLFLRGDNVITAYNDFMRTDKKFQRLAEDPTLTRDVTDMNITPVAGVKNSLIVDVKLVLRESGKTTQESRRITIFYELFSVQNRKDAEANPIGLFITDFKVGG
jgi:type IV secretory pathway component VirB8